MATPDHMDAKEGFLMSDKDLRAFASEDIWERDRVGSDPDAVLALLEPWRIGMASDTGFDVANLLGQPDYPTWTPDDQDQ